MAPKWVSKVPWTTIAEFFLGWWKNRKAGKDDTPKTGSENKEIYHGPVVDSDEARPVK